MAASSSTLQLNTKVSYAYHQTNLEQCGKNLNILEVLCIEYIERSTTTKPIYKETNNRKYTLNNYPIS